MLAYIDREPSQRKRFWLQDSSNGRRNAGDRLKNRKDEGGGQWWWIFAANKITCHYWMTRNMIRPFSGIVLLQDCRKSFYSKGSTSSYHERFGEKFSLKFVVHIEECKDGWLEQERSCIGQTSTLQSRIVSTCIACHKFARINAQTRNSARTVAKVDSGHFKSKDIFVAYRTQKHTHDSQSSLSSDNFPDFQTPIKTILRK